MGSVTGHAVLIERDRRAAAIKEGEAAMRGAVGLRRTALTGRPSDREERVLILAFRKGLTNPPPSRRLSSHDSVIRGLAGVD